MKYFICLGLLLLNIAGFAQEKHSKLDQSVERGAMIYADFCINCHLISGEGVSPVYPPLAKSDFLIKKRMESIKAIKFGMSGEITVNGKVYNSVMAAPGLDDQEIADVMNYILSNWGNKIEKPISLEEVSNIKE